MKVAYTVYGANESGVINTRDEAGELRLGELVDRIDNGEEIKLEYWTGMQAWIPCGLETARKAAARTARLRERACGLRERGKSIRRIADKLGVPEERVYDLLDVPADSVTS